MSELEPSNLLPSEVPLALENEEFIKDSVARPLRILGEYIHPHNVLNEQGVTDTVVFFGSARTPAPKTSDQIEHKGLAHMDRYYHDARSLAAGIASWSIEQKKQGKRHAHICTGGGPGIMEAANRGAHDVGAQNVGLNIVLPHEQHSNPYISSELNFNFQYFFMRKYWFLYYARVLIVFPGGFGTMDELFETLTLRQTKIIDEDIKILLYGKEYWERTVDFAYMADCGMISDYDLKLFQIVDDVPTALEQIVDVLSVRLLGK